MFKGRVFLLAVLMTLLPSFIILCKKGEERFDILIKNGKVVDGTGNPWFYGDVGIKGDTIVEIGNLKGKSARKLIDAGGFVVSPGFIDMHTHCDRELGEVDSNANLNYLTQGVTTVVTGNCGGSVSLKVLETKAKWEAQGIGTNAVFLVGHGNIRREVMGDEPREATKEEIEKMKEILRRAMEEGAWGISTGLEYIPGRYSHTEELIALTKVVGEFGGVYTSHLRDENDGIVEAIKETIRIAEESGARVNVAHFKVTGKNNWGLMEVAVKEINEARKRGVYITADLYPYVQSAPFGPIWSFVEIPNEMKPLAELKQKMRSGNFTPEEKEKLKELYLEELEKALKDESKREEIKKMTIEGLSHAPSSVAMWGWHDNTVMVSDKYPYFMGKNFIDIFEKVGGEPFDIIVDFILNDPEMLYAGGSMSEEDLRHALKQPWVMVSSDGSAMPIKGGEEKPVRGHPRCFGSFPKVFRKYVREEKLLSVEEAVRKMTSLPASFLQMKDRGLLLRGYKADVVIFDPDAIKDNATYVDSQKYSYGIEYVLVNGKVSLEKSNYTKTLSGRLLLLTEKR